MCILGIMHITQLFDLYMKSNYESSYEDKNLKSVFFVAVFRFLVVLKVFCCFFRADHISRVVADLEPMLTAELEKMDAVESEAGGLPLPCVIEGSAGGGGQSILAAPEDDGNAAASAASGGGFADSKSDSLIHSASSSNLQSSGRNVEDSYVDEDDYPVDEDDEDEDDYRASVPSTTSGPKKPPARNSFWGWMEQYFVPFGPQHLALLRETKVAGDPSFQIPRLGTHYAEKWGEDDGHARAGMEERPRIGEMTARVLAALVVTDVDGASKKPKRRPDAESMKKARADEAGAGVPFSKELAASVDDKLRAVLQLPQLQPLGLPGLPAAEGREDDEICETIRSLQSQLKQQIKVNNALKAELRPVVEKRMELQAKEEETKKEWAVALARYDTLMSTKRKK